MSYIIDIILICVILLIVFISSKKGIVLTVADIASGVLAFVISKLISPEIAEVIYYNGIQNSVISFLTEKYTGVENGIANAVSNITSVFDFLPDGIEAFINSSGYIDSDSIASGIMSSITTVSQLESEIVAPVVISVINIICFAVISFVLLLVLRFVGRLIAKFITSIKIADKLDSLLGAVFGLVKGVIYVFVIAAIINIISFSSQTLASYATDSYICGFVADFIGL